MDTFGGVAPLRDRRDRQVVAAEDAIAAGPHLGHRRTALGVDLDAAVLQCDRRAAAVKRAAFETLAYGLEHLVRRDHGRLAGSGELVTLHRGVFHLDAG